MSTTCAVCGRRVRVSHGTLVRHRDDGGVCDNSGCSQAANDLAVGDESGHGVGLAHR